MDDFGRRIFLWFEYHGMIMIGEGAEVRADPNQDK
jgi:hypothetical protein